MALVGGAFWLKTRPKPAVVARPAAQESTEALLARGIREHTAGSHDAAMGVYHQVLMRDPANASAHYNLGQIYAHRGQFAQAQWEYEAALKGDPKFLDARLNLGVVLYKQKRFPDAIEAFRQVLKASPKHALGLFNLGVTHLDLGHADEAIRWRTAALREDSKRADTHYYLGLALERQWRLLEAKGAFQKALDLGPGHAHAYMALARVYMAQGDQRLAQEALKKAAELDPRLKQ